VKTKLAIATLMFEKFAKTSSRRFLLWTVRM